MNNTENGSVASFLSEVTAVTDRCLESNHYDARVMTRKITEKHKLTFGAIFTEYRALWDKYHAASKLVDNYQKLRDTETYKITQYWQLKHNATRLYRIYNNVRICLLHTIAIEEKAWLARSDFPLKQLAHKDKRKDWNSCFGNLPGYNYKPEGFFDHVSWFVSDPKRRQPKFIITEPYGFNGGESNTKFKDTAKHMAKFGIELYIPKYPSIWNPGDTTMFIFRSAPNRCSVNYNDETHKRNNNE